jgi:L-aminopeptidase/D-esterase-like protein
VNAIGCIVNRAGQVVRGHLDRTTGTRSLLHEQVEHMALESEQGRPTRNTTLTLVVTNQKISGSEQTQLGRQVHASLARALQPFHTPFDGDTLFTATTSEVENPSLSPMALGAVASELAWDAVLNSYEEEAPS